MFGYILCNKADLTKEELNRYTSFYCGVCKSLGRQFGQIKRCCLNFDMTFVAMFLSAMYEGEEQIKDFRCGFHIKTKKQFIKNEFIDYAAALTVAYAYFKSIDDWNDDKKIRGKAGEICLESSYRKVKRMYPRQCDSIERCLKRLGQIEKNPDSTADDAVNCAGNLTSEIFVYKEGFFSDELREFGYHFGRFIYLMDAVMDLENDKKTGNFNPLKNTELRPKDFEHLLQEEMGFVTEIFERLPIIQDEHIISNILYGGVWLKYNGKFNEG